MPQYFDINSVVWTEEAEEHIGRHNVGLYEVEEVMLNGPRIRNYRGRKLLFGRTDAGRYLLVVLRNLSGGSVAIVTARDMTPSERRAFNSKRTSVN